MAGRCAAVTFRYPWRSLDVTAASDWGGWYAPPIIRR